MDICTYEGQLLHIVGYAGNYETSLHVMHFGVCLRHVIDDMRTTLVLLMLIRYRRVTRTPKLRNSSTCRMPALTLQQVPRLLAGRKSIQCVAVESSNAGERSEGMPIAIAPLLCATAHPCIRVHGRSTIIRAPFFRPAASAETTLFRRTKPRNFSQETRTQD